MAKYSIGLKSVKFGTPTGTVTMPVTMTAFANTVEGSMTIEETEAETKQFRVDELAAPIRESVVRSGNMTLKWKAYDIDPAIIAVVKSGTATSTKFSAAAQDAIIEKALEVTSDDNVVFTIPKASIKARITGQIGGEDMIQLEVSATAIDPGDGGSPWQIEHPGT